MKDLLPSVAGSEEHSYGSSIPDSAGQLAQQQATRMNGGDLEQGIPEDRQHNPKPPVPETPPPAGPRDATMDSFFKEVSEIKELLEQIKTQQIQLKDMHEKSLASTRTKEMKDATDAMKKVTDVVNKTASLAKKKLEKLGVANVHAAQVPGNEVGTSNERMRSAVSVGLGKKLTALLAEFGQLRQRIQNEHKEALGRRLYTQTGKKATEEEVDKMMDLPDDIFEKDKDEGQGKGHILDTLAEIKERHEAVQKLEKSLGELHQIFLDMAILVQAQGEQLDSIEAQVAKSMEFVAKGTEQLVQARELQKEARRLMIASALCAIIGITVIGGSIALPLLL